MLTTDTSQMQQYQDMINRQQQMQQGVERQIYQTQAEDPNQLHAQRTPIQGMPRSDIWKNLTFDPSWLQQTQNSNEAQGAQILTKPYQPHQDSSRMQPREGIYQGGLGSLFNNLGGPRQPQSAFENQFSELQNQMGGFGEQFTGLETSIGGLGESITAITDRLDSIEQGIKGLKTDDTSQAYTRMNWQPFSEWGRRRT